MKKAISLFLIFSVLFTLCFAHSGRTDSSGGHYERSTGEYHYHHGYPAHQHVNGTCPYNFDDKTNHNSGGSTKKADVKAEEKETDNIMSFIFFLILLGPGAATIIFFAIYFIADLINKLIFKKRLGFAPPWIFFFSIVSTIVLAYYILMDVPYRYLEYPALIGSGAFMLIVVVYYSFQRIKNRRSK